MKSNIFFLFALTILTACGGSGGGTSSDAGSSSSSASAVQTPIVQKTAPRVAGALLDTLSFVREMSLASTSKPNESDGRDSGSCEGNTGTYEIIVSNNGGKIEENYKNCFAFVYLTETSGKYVTLSGTQITTISNTSDDEIFTFSWKNYSIKENSEPLETIHGTAKIIFGQTITQINLDASTENQDQGKLEISNFIIKYINQEPNQSEAYLHNFLHDIDALSGHINLVGVGSADIVHQKENKLISMLGKNSTLLIYPSTNQINIDLDENKDQIIDSAVMLEPDFYEKISDHALLENVKPTKIDGTNRININLLNITPASFKEKFTSPSGHLLKINLEFIEGNPEDWERKDGTSFSLRNTPTNEYTIYRVYAYAIDIFGNQSDKFDISIHVSNDTDDDGVFDWDDYDDDNDGVGDNQDAFPLDPSESIDTDRDGIGNNSDEDIDNDNVINALDSYPLDHNCSAISEGDGNRCYTSLMSPRVLFVDEDGIFYLESLRTILDGTDSSKLDIIKWDSNTQKATEVVDRIIPNSRMSEAYLEESNLFLFLTYSSKTIQAFNPSTNTTYDFLQNQNEIINFSTDQGFLILTILEEGEIYYESYNFNGQLIERINAQISLNEIPTLISFRRNKLLPFCEISMAITGDGNFIEVGDRTKRWEDPCNSAYTVTISPDSTYALLSGSQEGAGIYNNQKERLASTSWFSGLPIVWSTTGLTYTEFVDGQPFIKVINPEGEILFQRALPIGDYEPNVYLSNEKVVVTSYKEKGGIRISLYDSELNPIE